MNIYGLLIGISVVLGIELIRKRLPILKITDILLILISALLGARILYLLHNIEEILSGIVNPFQIWDGGLAIYGAILGIFLSLFFLSIRKKLPFFQLSDNLLIYLPLLQSLGRIGNYFNKELYGLPTNLPWGIYIPLENRLEGYEQYSFFHPTFAYESILNLILFFVLKKVSLKKTNGLITGAYMVGYATVRILINMLRIDKEYIYFFETSDLLSGIFLGLGIYILSTNMTKIWKERIAKFLSRPVTVFLFLLTAILFISNTPISNQYLLSISLLSFVVPILILLLFKKLNLISDINATKREERPRLYLTMSIPLLISLFLSFKTGNTELVTIFLVTAITFFFSILVTLFWKISYHMIFNTLFIFIILYISKDPIYLLLLPILPAIGWSRLERDRHTLLQVIAGVILPLICIFLVLTLM